MVPGDVCYEAPLLSIAAREKIYGPLKFNMGHSNPTKATQIHHVPLKSPLHETAQQEVHRHIYPGGDTQVTQVTHINPSNPIN